jgi:hypothetical protein
MTRIVSSKAEFKSEIAAADRVGHRLAFVLVKEPGVFELTFLPLSEFTDYSTGAAS